LQFGWTNGETVVMAAKNGAFASGVNEDEGLVAGAVGRSEKVRFDSSEFECGAMDLRGVIVTKFANVSCVEAPSLASDHGAGNFPAGKDTGGFELDFGAARGKFGERDKGIRGVEADADNVNLGNFCCVRAGHWKRVVR
jgi:hypothetical protein